MGGVATCAASTRASFRTSRAVLFWGGVRAGGGPRKTRQGEFIGLAQVHRKKGALVRHAREARRCVRVRRAGEADVASGAEEIHHILARGPPQGQGRSWSPNSRNWRSPRSRGAPGERPPPSIASFPLHIALRQFPRDRPRIDHRAFHIPVLTHCSDFILRGSLWCRRNPKRPTWGRRPIHGCRYDWYVNLERAHDERSYGQGERHGRRAHRDYQTLAILTWGDGGPVECHRH